MDLKCFFIWVLNLLCSVLLCVCVWSVLCYHYVMKMGMIKSVNFDCFNRSGEEAKEGSIHG